MTPLVVVATKGRAREVFVLIDHLAGQRLPPKVVVVVGTSPADLVGLREHPMAQRVGLRLVEATVAGSCAQRNAGIEAFASILEGVHQGAAFVAFFDDDFRPAPDWLEKAAAAFSRDAGVAALTGHVLADGVRGAGLTEAEAARFLDGSRSPEAHWASGPQVRDVSSLYGCNMAIRYDLLIRERFDERLPLYGWQEDRDLTGRISRHGRAVYHPDCRGVHLGVKGERTSGVRLGYSQIANPVYLREKGTMGKAEMWRFVGRALLANVVKSRLPNQSADFAGRRRGNWLALRDIARGRLRPERILDL